jgi:hypothetical protein
MRAAQIGALQIGVNKYGGGQLRILQMRAAEFAGPQLG